MNTSDAGMVRDAHIHSDQSTSIMHFYIYGHACLSAYYRSETTKGISVKFGIVGSAPKVISVNLILVYIGPV
jgi:hypothetical protein